MSNANEKPFYANGPVALPDPSRYGIRLLAAPDGGYRYLELGTDGRPQRPDKPAILSPLPEGMLLSAASWLRQLWKRGHACGIWTLYVNTFNSVHGGWEMLFPPQRCGPDDYRADGAFPGVDKPEACWRLAGTIRSSTAERPDQLEAETMPRDGIHLVLHPAKPWVSLTVAFIVTEGQIRAADVADLIAEPRRDFVGLYERTQVAPGHQT